MAGARAATALVGIVGSLLVSAVLWWYFDSLVFFLFVPFVPFLFRGLGGSSREARAERERPVRTCPSCGFRTANDDFEYCPRDGRRLDR